MQTANMAAVVDQATGKKWREQIAAAAAAAKADPSADPIDTTEAKAMVAAIDKRAKAEPFAKAIAESIEVGVLVPSLFRRALAEAGFRVIEDEAAVSDYGFSATKVLKRALVVDKKANIVAMGAAGDHGEAIAHAALGWLREHPLSVGEAMPEGMMVAEGAGALGKPATPNA